MIPCNAFRSILFPVDFSPMTEVTSSHVRGMAEVTGAQITLLHVIPWLSAWYGATELRPAISGSPDLLLLRGDAQKALERFRKKHLDGLPCGVDVRPGAVAETITETAAELNADLIMMPTRGLGKTRPFLIGSTTAKVLHDAACATWTSPHLSSLPAFACYKHILCTVDRKDVPPGYLEEVSRLVSCFGSRLSFVSAMPSLVGGYGEEHLVQSLASEFPQAHIHDVPSPADCRAVSGTGTVGDVVRQVAETHGVDLVVTNRGHIQHPFGRFRTHTYEIVIESPCPVLSLGIVSTQSDSHT